MCGWLIPLSSLNSPVPELSHSLHSLIEDFLMNKEVFICEKMGQKVSDGNKYHNLDSEADILIYCYTRSQTVDQLISTCILLGSICVEVDRVDIILEVSYKIVHMGRSNLSWTVGSPYPSLSMWR
jgi:hypothetical protein